jgi:hypothetical protein
LHTIAAILERLFAAAQGASGCADHRFQKSVTRFERDANSKRFVVEEFAPAGVLTDPGWCPRTVRGES